MEQSKLIDDIDKHTQNLKDLGTFLDYLYYNSSLTRIVRRPFIGYLVTGKNFLISNLEIMKQEFENAGE